MSLFQNKFQNAYINTTANSSYLISSTYQSDNSLVNKGKSEFENNVVFDQRVAIGKATDAAYALDISGNVRIANGNLTGGGVVSVSNQNTFTENQTFNNPVGFGKIWDSVYAIDVSGSIRITGGSVIGGNVASIKTDNSYDGKQTFLSQVGIRKTWDNAFSLDVSGNMRIANGNLTGGNVASLIAQNTFTQRNRFNDALTINCNFTSYQLDVSGNLRVQNGTSTFLGNVSMTGTQATVSNDPINDSGIVNRGYANTNYARLTSNNILTGNQDWKSENNLFDYPPFCANGPTDANHLCRKSYVDGAFVNYATSNTTYSGFNNYDPHLPTSLTTPTLPEQFTTKAYVDSVAVATTTYVDSRSLRTVDANQNHIFTTNMGALTSGIQNTAIGVNAGNANTTGSRNTYVGYGAAASFQTTGSDNVFLGANSGTVGNYSNCVAIGASVLCNASNQVRIGTPSQTVLIEGSVSVEGQVLNSILDVSNNITIGTLGYIPYQYYAVDASGTITATLGTSSGLLGQTATFRRVGGNTTAQVLSASSNIYPLDSFTATNVILDASENLVRITRLRNSAGTAGWYKM